MIPLLLLILTILLAAAVITVVGMQIAAECRRWTPLEVQTSAIAEAFEDCAVAIGRELYGPFTEFCRAAHELALSIAAELERS